MQRPKWLIFAKNEYRIITSSFRRYRLVFPVIAFVLVVLFVGYLMPMLVDQLVDEVQSFFLSVAALAMVEIILFMFFFVLITWPISYALKEIDAGELENILKAPVRPSDLLLGRFMGQLPFYAIGIALIAGIFTALMDPLGLNWLQISIVVIIFILIPLSGFWIGTVLAAILRTRLGRSARGKDIGNFLSLIIALPSVALMYAFMGGGLYDALSDPDSSGMVNTVLGWLPSSWGAQIIIDFAKHPDEISSVLLGTLARLAGIIIFFVSILWIGAKAADRAYSLESTGLSSSTVKPDGAFYRTVRDLGGSGSFGTLLVSIFKDYGRRLQNISKIVYILALLIMLNVFFVGFEKVVGVLMMGNIMFAMLATFVVGEVTLRGKEALFIYRKAPSGEDRLIKGRLIQGWLIVLPVAAVMITIPLSAVPDMEFLSLLAYMGFVVSTSGAYVALALGLSFIMPAYSEKSGEFIMMVMVVNTIAMMVFIPSLMIFDGTLALVFGIALSWVVAGGVLSVGRERLKRIE